MSVSIAVPVSPADLTAHFAALVQDWKKGRGVSSSSRELSQHPAYRAIIDLGEPVVTLVLREMEREPDHWFIALKTITNADPVQLASRGNLSHMTRDWLNWGRTNGYRW